MFVDMESDEEPKKGLIDGSHVAMIALVLGIFVFTMSVTTPWIMDIFDPAYNKQTTVEAAKSAITSEITGEISGQDMAESSRDVRKSIMNSVWTLFVIGGSVLTLALGLIAFIRREDTRMAAMAMAFGFLAIFAQYMMVFAGILLVLIILYLVLASFGVT